MKKIITMGLIAMGIFGSASAQKIGYVSADEIIALMPEAARADSILSQYQEALYQNAQNQQDELNQAVQKFYQDSSKMNAGVKEVKRQDLQKSISELSGIEQKIQASFEQKRQELSGPIQKKLQTAIQEVAKENGYSYVLPKEALLVMPPADDIADKVKAKMGLKNKPAAARPAAGR